MSEIKKLWKKYNLADFDKVNKELEVQAIELDKWDFLNAVVRVVLARLNKQLGIPSAFFVPGGYYSNVIMNSVKDKDTHEKAKKLYKELMVLYHEGLIAEHASEDEQVQFFSKYWERHDELKERCKELLVVCQNVFAKEEENEKPSRGAYLG